MVNGTVVKRGKKYSVVYREKNPVTSEIKQKWLSGYKTRKEADEALLEIKMSMKNNNYVTPSRITLGKYLADWINNRDDLKQTTRDGYCVNIYKHIIPHIGDILLQEINDYHIELLYDNLAAEGRCDKKGGLSSTSIRYVHNVLAKALNDAVKQRLLRKNPLEYVDAPKRDKYKAKVLDGKDVIRLLHDLNGDDLFIPVALASILGMRRGEVCGLQWQSVDLENTQITIDKQLLPTSKGVVFENSTKSDDARILQLPDFIAKILHDEKRKQEANKRHLGDAYKDNNLVVCQENGEFLDPRNLSKKFNRLIAKLDYEQVRYHDLRHSCASMLLNMGVDIKTISSYLGHSNIGITADTYTQVNKDTYRQMSDMIQKEFDKYKK